LESVQPPPRRAVPGAGVITRRRCNDRSVTFSGPSGSWSSVASCADETGRGWLSAIDASTACWRGVSRSSEPRATGAFPAWRSTGNGVVRGKGYSRGCHVAPSSGNSATSTGEGGHRSAAARTPVTSLMTRKGARTALRRRRHGAMRPALWQVLACWAAMPIDATRARPRSERVSREE
jgi:hypothetical protein